jgi:hypothetical protein
MAKPVKKKKNILLHLSSVCDKTNMYTHTHTQMGWLVYLSVPRAGGSVLGRGLAPSRGARGLGRVHGARMVGELLGG